MGLLAGIARPDSLRRTLEGLGAEVVAERTFRDHHQYRASDLDDLVKQASLWVTTEKDALKLRAEWSGAAELWVLGIEVELEEGEAFLDWLSNQVR